MVNKNILDTNYKLNTEYETQTADIEQKILELETIHDKELEELGFDVMLFLQKKLKVTKEMDEVLIRQSEELNKLKEEKDNIYAYSTNADMILHCVGGLIAEDTIYYNHLLFGDIETKPVVSMKPFKGKDKKYIFNDKALINIHNQVVYKRAIAELEKQNLQEEYSKKSIVTQHKKTVDIKSLEKYQKRFEIIKSKTLEKSLMKYIEDYVEDDFIPLFITMTINPKHNITEEDIEQNVDIKSVLEQQYEMFMKFIGLIYKKINENLKLNDIERLERITVNEATKRLNTHIHCIFLVKKEGLEIFMRLLFNHWNKQENIASIHIEPILDYKYFDKVVQEMPVRKGAKKKLFDIKVFNSKKKLLAEKGNNSGIQMHYTKPKENAKIEYVGAYVFKYVMKEEKFAGDELFPKVIDNTLIKSKLLPRDRDKVLKIILREYKKTFYLTRLGLNEKMYEIFKDIEKVKIEKEPDYKVDLTNLSEMRIIEYFKAKDTQDQINQEEENEIIENMINEWEEYSYENYERDNSLYSSLRELTYIEETGILKEPEVLGWFYYIFKMEQEGDLVRENFITNIGKYEETANQNQYVKYDNKDTKYLDLLKEKAGIKEPTTAILQNQVNLYVTDFTNPYQAKLSKKNRAILRGLDTQADFQKKIMSNIENNIEIIDEIEVVGKRKNININKIFNKSKSKYLDLDKTFEGLLLDEYTSVFDYIEDIANYYAKKDKNDNIDYDIIFLTYTNNIRQQINKTFQEYTNENEAIGDTGFKLYDKIIYTDNDLYYMGITKNDIFKIVKVYKDKVFLKRNETEDISIHPLKVLNTKWDLAYSITIHNSQGQSFNNVCVIQEELKGFDMRLLYVALSRAKNKLITMFSHEVIKKLELITGNLHIKHKDRKTDYSDISKVIPNYEDMDINQQLEAVSKNIKLLQLNDFKQHNIFQSNSIKYKDIKDINVPTTKKIMEYTGWYGLSLYNEENEIRLNNYLISEFKHNQNFGVHRDVLIELGYEIPKRYDNQDIIVATGIKEHYENVLNKLSNKRDIPTDFELKTDIDNKGFHSKQIEFVKKALKQGFTILTGEGGTGKTHTIKELYENLLLNGVENDKIQFTAPTNSACKVIKRNISNANVSTIHKLADIDANMNKRRTDNVNSFEYVIVDEVSMLDYRLLNELIDSLDENTRLIIVGDYNQLPPVNGISVLEDMIEQCKEYHNDLTHQFRATSDVLSNLYKTIRSYI
jgi:hypothetical protein